MSLKSLSAIVVTIFMSIPAYSMELSCSSKYFINEPAKVQLSAQSGSENELSNLTLVIDGETVRENPEVQGVQYDGRKFKNMLAFKLKQTAGISKRWESLSLSLLLPQGWGEQGRFVGIIVEKAADGGSYNKVYCYTID